MLARIALVLGIATTVACAAPALEAEEQGSTESAVIGGKQDGEPTGLPEVVQVLVNNRAQDYCTGVLVSPTRVLTAAHCMGGTTFVVKAPYAPGRPQSNATKLGSVVSSRAFNEEVWKEDAAVLTLATPIEIEHYPELRDVGELGDETLTAVAVGRQWQERNAPLVKSTPLTVFDGTPHGYTTGLGSEYYSSGGDSGGPLFLVEDGEIQHVVIGIERQPDPPREWFTRITPAVKALVAKK
ncbi:MAG: trypsin-like serine protease [Labilithrix sp.]|nr:trypsin-like serine protease [Labilithrix sp.]MCW5815028.1 trypsin-like serine protease [Labilithrix sp.]